MKYIFGAFQYVFKNFLFLFGFALIPSYFLTLTVNFDTVSKVFDSFFQLKTDLDFLTIFQFLSPNVSSRWPFGVICFATTLIFLPLLFGFIEKHMRIGSRSLKGLAARFNYNFLATFSILLICAVLYELWALITAGLLFAESVILGGIVCYVVAVITFLGMLALMSYLFSLLLMWLPCKLITGYNAMDALSYGNNLGTGRGGKLFLSLFLPVLAGLALQVLAIWLGETVRFSFIGFAAMEIVFLIMILYSASLMFVAYFDATGEERMDKKKIF